MAMTNKQYKQAREEAENAYELDTFVTYSMWGHANRYMKPDDQKDMRKEYREIKADRNAFALEGFNGRALILPGDAGNALVLRSYYTDVCSYNPKTGEFFKLWEGYSNTTLKHINIFRSFLKLPQLSKREWIELEAI